jgi:hypothetical protein
MKQATLFLYREDENDGSLWHSAVIDNDDGTSIHCTEKVPSRDQAMLDGATTALEQGYSVALNGAQYELACNDNALSCWHFTAQIHLFSKEEKCQAIKTTRIVQRRGQKKPAGRLFLQSVYRPKSTNPG